MKKALWTLLLAAFMMPFAAMAQCDPGVTSCSITIQMTDSYGDGWNNSMGINVYQGTTLRGTATLASGSSGSQTIAICSGDSMYFVLDGDDVYYESSFTILNGDGTTILSGDCSDYEDGDTITVAMPVCPSCIAVTGLTASNITSSGLTLTWSDASNSGATYTVYDMSDTSVVATSINDTTYTISGLNAATGYTFGVEANCSATDASSIVTIATRTDCANGSCNLTVNATDSYGDGWNGNAINVYQNGGLVGSATISSGSSAIVSIPVCSGDTVVLTFAEGNYADEMGGYITDGGGNTVFTISSMDNRSDGDTLATIATPCPSCLMPIVSYSGLTSNSVTLTWDGANSGATYTVYNMADTSVMASSLTDTTYTISSLTANTAYTFGVEANCSATDASSIATVSISTPCEAFTAPFTEGFESGSLNCWSNEGTGSWTVGTGDHSTSTNAHSGTYNAMRTHSSSGSTTKLISPIIDLSATSDAKLVFWHVQRSWGGDIDELTVYYRTAADSSWQQLANYTDAVSEWTMEALALPTSSATVQVAFEMYDSYGYGVGIDDIFVGDTNLAVQVDTFYTLTANVNDTAMGAVYSSGSTYEAGDTAYVFALSNVGYRFVNWTSGTTVLGTDNPLYLAITSDTTITANFELDSTVSADSLTLTTAVNDATMGTITPAPGTYRYGQGDVYTVTATPNSGYFFAGWIMSYDMGFYAFTDTMYNMPSTLSDTVGEYDLGISISLTALFTSDSVPVINTDSIVVTLAVNDATMGTTTPAPGVYTFAEADTFYVTATPYAGYHFNGWRMQTSMYGYTIDTTIYTTENVIYGDFEDMGGMVLTLTALFSDSVVTPDTSYYTVTVDVNDTAMGMAYGGGNWYDLGDTAYVFAFSNPGYRFVNWTSGTTVVSTDNPYEFVVTGDISLTANFELDSNASPDSLTLTTAVADATMGTVTPAPGTYRYGAGEIFTVTATPNDGYYFSGWIMSVDMGFFATTDTVYVWQGAPASFSDTADYYLGYVMSMTALFTSDSTVTPSEYVTLVTAVNDATMGTMTPAPGTYTYAESDSVAFTFTPADGHYLHSLHFTVTYPGFGTIVDETQVLGDSISLDDINGQYIDFEGMAGMTVTVTAIFAVNGQEPPTGINDADLINATVYSADSRIFVRGAEGSDVRVYDMSGRTVAIRQSVDDTEIRMAHTGVYLVKVGNVPAKRVLVVR